VRQRPGGPETAQIPPELALPLGALLAKAPLVLFALDRQGVFTASEGAGLRALGLESGEVVGRSVFEVYAQLPWILETMNRALGGESLKSLGEIRGTWWETHVEPVRDEGGQMLGVVGLASDVTQRHRAEEQMVESEERFRRLAEATFEAIAISEQGRVLLANEACAALFGYEPRELIGMSVIDLAAPESRALVAANVQEGREEAYEATGLCKDGSRFPAELRARAIKYRGRPVRVTAVRDLTAHKRSEAALRQVVQLRETFLAVAAQQLDVLVASLAAGAEDAGMLAAQIGKLREVASTIQNARRATPEGEK
jgi:PAS domain S-box-containing protein